MTVVNANDFVNQFNYIKPDNTQFWNDFILGALLWGMDKGIKIENNLPNVTISFNNEVMGSIKLDGAAKASFNSYISDLINMNFVIE